METITSKIERGLTKIRKAYDWHSVWICYREPVIGAIVVPLLLYYAISQNLYFPDDPVFDLHQRIENCILTPETKSLRFTASDASADRECTNILWELRWILRAQSD